MRLDEVVRCDAEQLVFLKKKYKTLLKIKKSFEKKSLIEITYIVWITSSKNILSQFLGCN